MTIELEGRVYIAFADGCTGTCASGNNSQPADSRTGRGSVYFMANGPSLYVENGEMTSPVESPPPEMSKVMQFVVDIEAVRQENNEG